MIDSMEQFRRELAQLKKKYAGELLSKIDGIHQAWNDFHRAPDMDKFALLHRLVHTVKGSSATFGFDEVSHAAATLEALLKPWVAMEALPDERIVPEFEGLFNTLWSKAREVVPTASPASASASLQGQAQTQANFEEPELCVPFRDEESLIYFYCTDSELAEDITSQMASFSFDLKTYTALDHITQDSLQQPPAGFIVDFSEFSPAHLPDLVHRLLAPVSERLGYSPPLIAVSDDDAFSCRLAAVRSGAADFYTLPLDVGNLVDSLGRLIHFCDEDPFRILIIDDDKDLARHFELVLQGKGWLTKIVADPSHVLDDLSEFRPDLILMDLYMPDVNGVELARVIRQKEEYVSIPIVYLSIEDDLETQIEAISLGADDFLNKRIHPEHLIASVESRVLRYRELRRLMTRDSLTGLLNHTNLKMRLELELKRAQRQKMGLAFAMIDLDHFKKVNDTYGHPTGDLVLKSVAKLLNQRLRRTDVIGRYGGEEFGVILLDVESRESVFGLLDNLRESFAHISHNATDKPGETFHVTLSCGVAMFPDHADPKIISDAADKALYKAKSEGRNRVVIV